MLFQCGLLIDFEISKLTLFTIMYVKNLARNIKRNVDGFNSEKKQSIDTVIILVNKDHHLAKQLFSWFKFKKNDLKNISQTCTFTLIF